MEPFLRRVTGFRITVFLSWEGIHHSGALRGRDEAKHLNFYHLD